MRPVAATGRRPGRGADPAGSLSLEIAMALPLLALGAFAVLQLVGVGRDLLLVQELAALGARVAATTTDDTSVAGAVHAAAGDGHVVDVVITPSPRRRGDLVTVRVVLQTTFGPFTPRVTAGAVGRGEPSLSGGS